MMIPRYGHERGHASHGWLDTYHTFSFAHYVDMAWMGFGPLRVINEDRIEGHQGFAEHFHAEMEILTYVMSGALAHKDSLGNGSIIRPSEIQYMSAGTGIMHSEENPEDAPVHLFQIWIQPNIREVLPRYGQQILAPMIPNTLQYLASPNGKEHSLEIRQDADVARATFDPGEHVISTRGRLQWLHVISGSVVIGNILLTAGDAVGCENEPTLTLTVNDPTHILFFDMITR